jgi:fatty-acyl-CoA synthase
MAGLTWSYSSGIADRPLIGETIGRHFDRAVARRPDGDALIIPPAGIRWSWAELARRVDGFAAGLIALGLEPGERIGIWSPNNAEWVVTQFAAAKAGLILVTINPAYRTAELDYALGKAGCAALILAPRFKRSDYVAMLTELVPEIAHRPPGRLRSARLPQLRWPIAIGEQPHPGCLRFDDVPPLAGERHRQRLAELDGILQFDDPVNIQFTSGTTGAPKGATLSHHNILNNAYFTGLAIGLGFGDRVCIPVPLYHCFGMVIGNLACMAHGAAMVCPGEGFDPLATLQAVEAERCTVLYGVPTMFIAQLGHPEFARFDLGSLRTGIMAGAPCPIEIMKRCIEEMHMAEVTIAYGMTETSPVSLQTCAADPLELRVATVGRVHPHVEVKIVDPAGRLCPTGVAGELCTRGYSVMLGYWDDPERTREAIDAAGWMHTGDLATLDEAGYCRIVGRLKDMVIRGGDNIYPREIEEFLFAHPKIAAAEIVGVPDSLMGEELCAWIRLRAGETATAAEIQAWCRDRIAHFKIPRYVKFVEEFPLTVTGKVQKYRIREQMIAELPLAAISLPSRPILA